MSFNQTVFAMTNESIKRLEYKAQNQTSKLAIRKFCFKEDPGLEIDSDIANQMMFSKECKCAIESGKNKSDLEAQNFLNMCSFN